MVSVGGYGAIGALLNYGAGVVTDRSVGWLRQLRITPLSPTRVVVAKGIVGMLLSIPPVLAMCLAAALLNGVHLPALEWLTVVGLLVVGAAPFVLLGLGIGYLCTAQTVQPANFLVYFGFSILGGLWLPLKTFPHWMQDLGRYLPTHGYADLSWRVVFHDPVAGLDLVVLAAWMVAFAAFAVLAYRRSASRKDA
jgi:ABC-2 type transport system permease protein